MFLLLKRMSLMYAHVFPSCCTYIILMYTLFPRIPIDASLRLSIRTTSVLSMASPYPLTLSKAHDVAYTSLETYSTAKGAGVFR
jgi:hypothetical protein